MKASIYITNNTTSTLQVCKEQQIASGIWNTKRFKSRNLWVGAQKFSGRKRSRFLGAKRVDFWAQKESISWCKEVDFWAQKESISGRKKAIFLGDRELIFWALGRRFLGLGYIQIVPFRTGPYVPDPLVAPVLRVEVYISQ